MNNSIIIDDKFIFYRVIGSGNRVVLLHGFAEDGKIWEQQVEFLKSNYQLIIPDLPGSGQSSLTDKVNIESMADVVYAILEKEHISETVMIGHSMGGYITLAFARKYPMLLKGFGLFHSTAYPDNEDREASRKSNIEFIRKNNTHAFLKQSVPTLFSNDFKTQHPEIVDRFIDRYKTFSSLSLEKYQEAMMRREERTDILKQFVKPILFIIGKHDNAIPFDDSLELCHLPSLSYIHILENSGHMGMIEESGKTNWILNKFLRDLY
ncbi:MAG: alpha/beta hydrolase [Chitinophagaceae bacterium]